jgi:hypothetical protein
MAKLSDYIGQSLNFRIKEIFGTVSGTVIGGTATDYTISFTSFGSAYVTTVPKHWVMTKSTDGKPKMIKQGVQVSVNIETPEIASKRFVLEEVTAAGLLVSANGNVRFITWDSIKEIRVPKEKDAAPAKARSAVPGKVGKAAAAPAAPARRAAPPAAPLRRAAR